MFNGHEDYHVGSLARKTKDLLETKQPLLSLFSNVQLKSSFLVIKK